MSSGITGMRRQRAPWRREGGKTVQIADGQPDAGCISADQLSDAELDLLAAARAGRRADLGGRAVRASIVRDVVLEARPGWLLPAAGLHLECAVIQGCLDLEGVTLVKPLLFCRSRFEGGGENGAIVIRDARLRRLGIHDCTVDGNLVADRAELENGLIISGGKLSGTLIVSGASIGGTLSVHGALVGDGSTALSGADLRVKGPVILRGSSFAGEIAVPRAHLESGLYAERMHVVCAGVALSAEGARLGGDLLVSHAEIEGAVNLRNLRLEGRFAAESLVSQAVPTAIDARGLHVSHGIVLDGARIRGSLLLDAAKVGTAFHADGVEIDGGETAISADVMAVGGNWEMPRAKLIGQLSCPGATVEGQLRLTEARLFGSDVAWRGDGVRIRGGCYLSQATILGLVRIPAAEFGNQFRLSGASIKVEAGTALLATGAKFNRDIELNAGFQARGAVVLDQTRVLGALDLTGSHIVSAAIARAGLPITPAWTVAGIAGDETALSLVDVEIKRVVMPAHADERPRGVVDLSRAHAGSFEDHATAWVPPPKSRMRAKDGRDIDHIVLDGFVCDHLTNPTGEAEAADSNTTKRRATPRRIARRIEWLDGQRDGAAHFHPRAWIALADRLARQGCSDDARQIDITRRRRERRSAALGARCQNRLLDWFTLYGHSPWRTVVWMAAVVVMFAGIWAAAANRCEERDCFDESVFVIQNKDAYRGERFRQTYPGFNALAYSFDVFVPFVSFGYANHWRANVDYGPLVELPLPQFSAPSGSAGSLKKEPTLAITIGGILYVLAIIEAILGLVLTSLMVTSFTGLLKRRGD